MERRRRKNGNLSIRIKRLRVRILRVEEGGVVELFSIFYIVKIFSQS
jgi:hypothetical protein